MKYNTSRPTERPLRLQWHQLQMKHGGIPLTRPRVTFRAEVRVSGNPAVAGVRVVTLEDDFAYVSRAPILWCDVKCLQCSTRYGFSVLQCPPHRSSRECNLPIRDIHRRQFRIVQSSALPGQITYCFQRRPKFSELDDKAAGTTVFDRSRSTLNRTCRLTNVVIMSSSRTTWHTRTGSAGKETGTTAHNIYVVQWVWCAVYTRAINKHGGQTHRDKLQKCLAPTGEEVANERDTTHFVEDAHIAHSRAFAGGPIHLEGNIGHCDCAAETRRAAHICAGHVAAPQRAQETWVGFR